VLVDGCATKSCSVLALQADGSAVTTVEGLPALAAAPGSTLPEGALHPLQEAFMACHALQCGFCTPGMLMAAASLLAINPTPTDDEIVEALEGNLCRCTGYVNIVAAVRQAAQAMAGAAR
jgi:carbon-monoxide dehydrogenase small subunit